MKNCRCVQKRACGRAGAHEKRKEIYVKAHHMSGEEKYTVRVAGNIQKIINSSSVAINNHYRAVQCYSYELPFCPSQKKSNKK